MTPADTLTIDGVTQPISEWALDYGIYPGVIVERLQHGWSAGRAVAQPMLVARCQKLNAAHMPGLPKVRKATSAAPCVPKRNIPEYEFDGMALTLRQWSAHIGIKLETLKQRLRGGMEIGDALTRPVRIRAPGVGKNFAASEETGGWSVAQDIPQIEFSE